MHSISTVIESPVGPLMLTATEQGLTQLSFQVRDAAQSGAHHPVLARAKSQLAAYFDGRLRALDLPVHTHGTPFQEKVWSLVRTIPYGTTASYGELAQRLGGGGMSRAVGRANGSNPVAIFIPCHRVVGTSGALTGYSGGMDKKAFLLRLESRQMPLFPC